MIVISYTIEEYELNAFIGFMVKVGWFVIVVKTAHTIQKLSHQ